MAAGLALWVFILWRGLRNPLKGERDRGGLTHLLLYTSIGIPVFYAFAFRRIDWPADRPKAPEGSAVTLRLWSWAGAPKRYRRRRFCLSPSSM